MFTTSPDTGADNWWLTLTSTVYRLWCKLRTDLLDQWQLHLPSSMDYDRARPGAHVLHVALPPRPKSSITLAALHWAQSHTGGS